MSKAPTTSITDAPPFRGFPRWKIPYQFGEHITILQADDFKIVDHIDLAKPDFPGMENVRFGGRSRF